MSDTEKNRPDSPKEGDPEAKPSGGGAVVISIEQARAELLARPKRATPQAGVTRAKPRPREVPAPVTLPPGEHAAVIVTDTAAARAHVDKKTVHPGEMPAQTHEKKVRVKTSLDPRRAKTQITDRRASEPEPPPSESEHVSLWNRPPQHNSNPPPAASAPVPPRPLSLARPKPLPREKGAGVPMFVIGVILAAALGATVVYLLSRSGGGAHATAPTATTAAAQPATTAAATAPTVAATAQAAASTAAPASSAPATSAAAAATTSAAVKTAVPTVKASATASAAPAATAKPTATSVLPFGVGHD